jgi:hypothetical protein
MNQDHQREINQYLPQEENPQTAIVRCKKSLLGKFTYTLETVEEVVDYGDDGAFKFVPINSIEISISCEEEDIEKTQKIIFEIISNYGFLEGGTEWLPMTLEGEDDE